METNETINDKEEREARRRLKILLKEAKAKLRPYTTITPPDETIFKCWLCNKFKMAEHLRWASVTTEPQQVEVCDTCLKAIEANGESFGRYARLNGLSAEQKLEYLREQNRLRQVRYQERHGKRKKHRKATKIE